MAIIEHQLKIGSSAVRTIIHDHLHLKKVGSRFVPHYQVSEFQKAERVRICHETLNLLNNRGYLEYLGYRTRVLLTEYYESLSTYKQKALSQ